MKKHRIQKILAITVLWGLAILNLLACGSKQLDSEALSAEMDKVELSITNKQELPNGTAYTITLDNQSSLTIAENQVYLEFHKISSDGKSLSGTGIKVEAEGNRLNIKPGESLTLTAFVESGCLTENLFAEPFIEFDGYVTTVEEGNRFTVIKQTAELTVADDTDMVQFEMTKSIYDMQLYSVEKTADDQYVLSGVKYYPDIVLTDEEHAQLESVGLLYGFLDGEEMFQITKVDGTYQFAWGDEAAYEVQFVQKSFSAWEDGWVMGSADSSNPIGWHSYGPLDEAFKLTVPADQIIVSDGVRTQSWGITGETLTVKDLYEIYTGYGNKWSQDGEESAGLRIDEETDGIQMEIIYRP